MGVEVVNSKVVGVWKRLKVGRDEKGRATFIPNMEYKTLLRDKNFKVW